jgi:transposase
MTTELSNLATGTDLDAKIFVSLELSKSRWGMVLHRPSRSKFSHQLFDGGDVAAVIEYLQAQRLSEEKRLGRSVRVVTCYEAGRDGFWLDRALLAGGIDNRVFDAASLLVSRRAKKAKTDRLDGEGLLRTLMALERGDPGVVSLVRVPSVEDEDGRRLTRERERLVREETQHRNRITALLFTQGVRDVLLGRPRWTEKLCQLRTGDGRPLPPRLVAELEREGARLALVREQVAQVESEMKRAAAAQEQQAPVNQLHRLYAVGTVNSAILAGEVFSRKFVDRRHLASFVGLAPVPWASGGISRDQGLAKTGNPRVRVAMIELAWFWLRHQPDSDLSLWFRGRVGIQKGRVRRIAIVALARKLLVALWRFVTQGVVPAGARLRAA